MNISIFLGELIRGGLGNLASYLAAHVLLCLLPAFYIAGAMTSLIPKESVTRFLGRTTPKIISYPAAALAGSVLAVCSCTIVPLFAGIYKKGAGLGPAITFLFFAPAANILALIYTGGVIGADLAFARLILALAFGIGIGMIMALIFRQEDREHDKATDSMFAGKGNIRPVVLMFLLLLVVLLLSGTLKIGPLTNSYTSFTLPIMGAEKAQASLNQIIPYDASKGEEGVTFQGAVLIVMLALIGVSSWKGFENIFDGITAWTRIALGLTALTLLIAAVGFSPHERGLDILINGKSIAVLIALMLAGWLFKEKLGEHEKREFLWESWKFVKQIFPLLVAGVFMVGMIRVLVRPEWIETLAGKNTLAGNLAGVLFGVFMYFPTLVEVPIANMFLSLGMHRGPLLAYLMADPELSLQSILIISTIIGKIKTWTYVGWVALFSTLAGLIYGSWVNGASVALVGIYLISFLGLLGLIIWRVRRSDRTVLNHA